MVSESPIRVGIPISTFVLGSGLPGIDKYTYNLILALERHGGVRVTVFQEKHRSNGSFERFDICYFPILKELFGLKRRDHPALDRASVEIERSGKKKASAFGNLRRDIVKSLVYLSKGVDVIHYPTHMENPLPIRFSRTVLTFHDLVPLVHPETSTAEIIASFNRCVGRLRHVDALITVSEFTKNEMIGKLGISPDKITVCYHGVDPSFFVTEVREEVVRKYSGGSPYILFVGTLEPRKNVESLLEAYRAIDVPGLRILLVGKEGWGIRRIREKVRELGLDERVSFLGYVPEDDLPSLYRGAEVFVYPSLYEGFGIPVLEAMAAGAPVITSRVASLPEVTSDAAILVSPMDIHGIAEAIRGILKNRSLREALGAKGPRRARTFTWDRCARDVLAVYRRELS